jgi:hypothetical protein
MLRPAAEIHQQPVKHGFRRGLGRPSALGGAQDGAFGGVGRRRDMGAEPGQAGDFRGQVAARPGPPGGKGVLPGAGDHSAWPRSKCPAAQRPKVFSMTDGQSTPVASAARSATVGSARGAAGPGVAAAAFSAARSRGLSGEAQAASAPARSSSVIRPAAISAA